MRKILLFDVDGTIAESGDEIDTDIADLLKKIKSESCDLGIVGGGNIDKILFQINNDTNFTHLFSECGSVYHTNINGEIEEIYKKNIRKHPLYIQINTLIKSCLKFLSEVDYIVTGSFIDLRNGLVYISLIGMDANYKERSYFMKIDKIKNYRQRLLNILISEAHRMNIQDFIDIREGGSVGIAIYPTEWNKIQVLDFLNEYDEILYFGDKYLKGGNDYEIINDCRVKGYEIDSLQDTLTILRNIFDEILHE